MNRGFTMIELLVSIGVFIIMTSFVVAKFGNFNRSTLLTDTAYDIALAVRVAQTYGLSVRNASQSGTVNFLLPFGMDFNAGAEADCGTSKSSPTKIVLFTDSNPIGAPNGTCELNDSNVSTYLIIRGGLIVSMCAGADAASCAAVTRMAISFQRPNPEAKICASNGGATTCTYSYTEVTLQGTDESTRKIIMRQNGQITVSR